MLRAQDGERAAMEALHRRWQARLWVLARAWSADEAAAADALQEAWVSIFRGLRRLEDPAAFGAWAGRVLRRRCADEARRSARRRRREAAAARAGEQVAPSRGDEALRRAVDELDPETRALLRLFYAQGLGVGVIARVLGVAPGTVKSRLFRARERLAEKLAQEEGGP